MKKCALLEKSTRKYQKVYSIKKYPILGKPISLKGKIKLNYS